MSARERRIRVSKLFVNSLGIRVDSNAVSFVIACPSAIKLVRVLQRRAVSKITETENERSTGLEDSMDELVGVGFILSFPSEVDFEPEQLQLCDQLFYVDFDEESSSTRDIMVPLEER